tara:strand:+ start:123 stop:509 length:387 start_codon:yes stop_codon:yes gene_type:complete
MVNEIKKGNWIVLYYSESCGYCIDFLPIWNLFESKKQKNLNKLKINIATIDMSNITPPLNGVPSVHFYKNGKITKTGVFNEMRTLEGLNKFSQTNLKALKKLKSKNSKKSKKLKKSTKVKKTKGRKLK